MVVMPCNIDAEINLLGSMLLDNNVIGEVYTSITPSDFYDSKNAFIYNALRKMYAGNMGVDIVTLAESLGKNLHEAGGVTYLTSLFNSAIPGNFKTYEKIVKSYSVKRMLIKMSYETISKATDSETSNMDIITKMEDTLLEMVTNKKNEAENMASIMKKSLKSIDSAHAAGGKITGISTGFNDIDNKIDGLNKGDLIILAARPSMGKTAVVLNIAVNASEHHTVALFEQEMSNVQLGKRILASESLTSHDNIKKGNLTSDEFNDLKDTVKRLENYKLFVDETSGQSVNEIKAKCKRLKIKEGLDVVIIDYIQLLAGDSKSENRVQELTKISRALKVLAKELDVAVIALAQLSRAPEIRQEHRPMLADLRESGSIEQDADVVIMLYRDEYYNQNTDSKGTMEIIITKNRNGELGTIKMEWASQFQRVAPQFK